MKFVALFHFTPQGVANYRQTTKRAREFTEMIKSAGITVQRTLWTQGHYDGVLIFEAPDAETAAAEMLSLGSKGNIHTETMVAFDADDMDRLIAKAK
jgi:uncharacterized protein with GYD domain